MSRLKAGLMSLALALSGIFLGGCAKELIDNRIPAYPVYINLNNSGLWSAYGVSGIGSYRYFVREQRIPAGFAYLESTYTGFGGVLLFGNAPYFVDDGPAAPCMPVAYDLACPVEAKQDVRVYLDEDTFQAICPVCGSHYDVMGGGYPLQGPAKQLHYALTPYRCMGSWPSGFIITY